MKGQTCRVRRHLHSYEQQTVYKFTYFTYWYCMYVFYVFIYLLSSVLTYPL